MSFKNFGKRKKRKKSRCQPSGLYNGIFSFIIQVYYIKSEILLLVLHCLHDDLEVITTLQDDILQEV